MLIPAVKSYLALRRALGFKLKEAGYQLQSFARFADERGEQFIRTATAIEWAGYVASLPQRARRLGVIIRFARYLHAEDERHEIPPDGVYGSQTRPRRTPFILSPEQIQRLLVAASSLRPRGSLRPNTYQTLFALLACTGLRVSEAIRLTFADFTSDGLLIRQSKFRKSRLVPLHDTAQAGLERYLARRLLLPGDRDHLFVCEHGRPLRYTAVAQAFHTSLRRGRTLFRFSSFPTFPALTTAYLCRQSARNLPRGARPDRPAYRRIVELSRSLQGDGYVLVSRSHPKPVG